MPESGGGCCRCCCSFLFTLGLTALFMWLSLRTSSPDCLLTRFSIPALNKTLNSPNLTTLEFEMRLKNTNKDKGVYYDAINVTFFDSPNRSHAIGNYVIPPFRQGNKKKATKGGNITNIDVDSVSRLFPANGSTALFRVDLATKVRYRILVFKTKRHTIRVGANVEVNSTGTKVNHKDVKLKSHADKIRNHCVQMGASLVSFCVLGLVNFL